MAKATGIGGVFFKSDDPKKLKEWYAEHLGISLANDFDGASFRWREKDKPEQVGQTVWSLFDSDTEYLGAKSSMVNYRVDDLDGVLAKLRAAGVKVFDHIEEAEYGRFGWAEDPEGNRFELWQPLGEEGQDT